MVSSGTLNPFIAVTFCVCGLISIGSTRFPFCRLHLSFRLWKKNGLWRFVLDDIETRQKYHPTLFWSPFFIFYAWKIFLNILWNEWRKASDIYVEDAKRIRCPCSTWRTATLIWKCLKMKFSPLAPKYFFQKYMHVCRSAFGNDVLPKTCNQEKLLCLLWTPNRGTVFDDNLLKQPELISVGHFRHVLAISSK